MITKQRDVVWCLYSAVVNSRPITVSFIGNGKSSLPITGSWPEFLVLLCPSVSFCVLLCTVVSLDVMR
jgi:hypothetical protein